MKKPLVVCITGPTATGKTDASIAVCKALDGEVLSMDSMQIYEDCVIGTATPTAAEKQGVPHHLQSFVPPGMAYSVADYQRDASGAMQDVLARGMLPVFAGGTGLYLQAISHPLSFTKAGEDAKIRAELHARAKEPGGAAALHTELASVDPVSASRLHPNNTRRVIRALEVFYVTGIPMSAQTNDWEAEPEQDWLIFALNWPRETLYGRINLRVDEMARAGLVAEVEGLLARGVPPASQTMQAIGYKEIVEMLEGKCTRGEAMERIKMNTRRYAKRQLTWLRRDDRVRWIDLSEYESKTVAQAAIIREITQYKEKAYAED